MNIIIEEVVSTFPVLVTEQVFEIKIADSVSYFDLEEVANTDFVGKDGFVPVVDEATGKLVLQEQQTGTGGGLSLGETSTTAYRGDRGKTAYDHSKDITTNPHNVTKLQVGLGNVDNTSDLDKPISTSTQTVLNNKVDKEIGKGLSTNDFGNIDKSKLDTLEGVDKRVLTDTQLVKVNAIDQSVSASEKLTWNGKQNDLGFTPENSANKSDSYTTSSSTTYASTKALVDGIAYIIGLGYQTASQVGVLITNALASFKTSNFLDFTSSGQTQIDGKQNNLGFTPEDSANKSTSTSLGTSDVLYPSQKAVKTYADNLDDLLIKAQQDLGSTIKSIGLGVRTFRDLTGSSVLTDGSMRFIAVYLPKSQTITGVKWQQVTQGVYTADNENRVGLYTYSSGTMTLVASSADDGNLWKATSGTVGNKAFSTPYSANSGLYFIGILWNASATTTAPALGIGANLVFNSGDFTNSSKISSIYTTSTIPSSLAQSATASQLGSFGLFLY